MNSTETPWGLYQYDPDIYDTHMQRTVADLRREIKSRLQGEQLNWTAFWQMPKAQLVAIVSEWTTGERQNEREASKLSTRINRRASKARRMRDPFSKGGLSRKTRRAYTKNKKYAARTDSIWHRG
jgi:hypothetical protein